MGRSASLFVLVVGVVILVGLMGVVIGSTAANSVTASRAGVNRIPLTLSQVRPAVCAGLSLEVMISGQQDVRGTQLGDLILGTAGNDQLRGQNGDDCILAGAGKNEVDGGPGRDVCVVGPEDRVRRCEIVIGGASSRDDAGDDTEDNDRR